jgi:hypothetical protein
MILWRKFTHLWKNRGRTWATLGAIGSAISQSSGALHLPQRCCEDVAAERTPAIFLSTLEKNFVPLRQWDRVVYKCTVPPSSGDLSAARNRPVLVLHEYDHLSIACLHFAMRLSSAGFTVYVPLLFGKADGKVGLGTTLRTSWELAFSGQWHAPFRRAQASTYY